LEEYADYVNRMAEKSSLHKTEFKNKGYRIKKRYLINFNFN